MKGGGFSVVNLVNLVHSGKERERERERGEVEREDGTRTDEPFGLEQHTETQITIPRIKGVTKKNRWSTARRKNEMVKSETAFTSRVLERTIKIKECKRKEKSASYNSHTHIFSWQRVLLCEEAKNYVILYANIANGVEVTVRGTHVKPREPSMKSPKPKISSNKRTTSLGHALLAALHKTAARCVKLRKKKT